MPRLNRGLLVTCPDWQGAKGCGATFRYHGKIHREIRCACGHRFFAPAYQSLREDRLRYMLHNAVSAFRVVQEYGMDATVSAAFSLFRGPNP
jgi:hypothetical protein